MSESEMAVFEYRLQQSDAFRGVRKDLREQAREQEELREAANRHTEQISGDGGLQNGLRAVRKEMGSLRTAFYALTGSIIAGTIAVSAAIISHAL